MIPEKNDFVKMTVRDNVRAGHFQCGKMPLRVTFILAIVSEVIQS